MTGSLATANIFATYLPEHMTLWQGFLDEVSDQDRKSSGWDCTKTCLCHYRFGVLPEHLGRGHAFSGLPRRLLPRCS